MAFLFRPACTIAITLQKDKPNVIEIPKEEHVERLFVYSDSEPVKGEITLQVPEGKTLSHSGVKLELIGQIELFYDRGNHHEFLKVEYPLQDIKEELSGVITQKFVFQDVLKQHESYNGINVRLRYFVRCTIVRSLLPNITEECEIWVHVCGKAPEINNPLKMEVGIEDALHIEFEYDKSRYHLRDVIIGKIFFLIVRIPIKHMEISLIKRESTGSGPNLYHESDTVTKFEIMDGCPVKGESIPVRMFLGAFDLTPTYANVENRFGLKYFLNLVLVDQDDKRYFKQQEIVLWRKGSKQKKSKGEKFETLENLKETLSN